MAKGFKTGGRNFQKGHPGYKPKSPTSHKELKKLSHAQIEEVGQLILEGNRNKLIDISKDPDAPVLQIWIASCAVKAMQKGDFTTLDNLLNRIIGRVPQKHEIKTSAYDRLMDKIDHDEIIPEK